MRMKKREVEVEESSMATQSEVILASYLRVDLWILVNCNSTYEFLGFYS
jgi:hypothetical protein